MATLFIADLHLSESRPDISAAFELFISTHCQDIDALYVLGDLFEAWIGDDDDNPFIRQIKSAFRSITRNGIPVYFIHGNRDFLISKRFADDTGIVLLPEAVVVDLYGQSVLLMHGDTLCTDDVEYQAFRRKSRTWWWQTRMQLLPLWLRKRIAMKARRRSASQNQYKPQDIMDVNQACVTSTMLEFGVQQLIHGHTHRPAVHQLVINGQAATRTVLGDWYEHSSWLEFTPDQQVLYSSERYA